MLASHCFSVGQFSGFMSSRLLGKRNNRFHIMFETIEGLSFCFSPPRQSKYPRKGRAARRAGELLRAYHRTNAPFAQRVCVCVTHPLPCYHITSHIIQVVPAGSQLELHPCLCLQREEDVVSCDFPPWRICTSYTAPRRLLPPCPFPRPQPTP